MRAKIPIMILCTVLVISLAYAQVNLDGAPNFDAGVVLDPDVTNSTFGEMYLFNESAGYTISIDAVDAWYNVTNFSAGDLNGVDFDSDTYSLVIIEEGIYVVDYGGSFSGSGSQLHALSILVNGLPQDDCYLNRKLGTSGDVGDAGRQCVINLDAGDEIRLGVEDETIPTANDIVMWMSNVNVHKLERVDTTTIINNTPSDFIYPHDQDLNKSSNVTFNNITSTGYITGDGFKGTMQTKAAPVTSDACYNRDTDNIYRLNITDITGVDYVIYTASGYTYGCDTASWKIEIHNASHTVLETERTGTWTCGGEPVLEPADNWFVRGYDFTPEEQQNYHLNLDEYDGTAQVCVVNAQITVVLE